MYDYLFPPYLFKWPIIEIAANETGYIYFPGKKK